jgi:EAL domain-containing protein (putative c-di-GMP-specific phosphodiesterase class I)
MATKIVRTVINMAHDLGLRSVAEGIETPEQCAALVDLQCDELQGYLFGRPRPMEQLVRSMVSESGRGEAHAAARRR